MDLTFLYKEKEPTTLDGNLPLRNLLTQVYKKIELDKTNKADIKEIKKQIESYEEFSKPKEKKELIRSKFDTRYRYLFIINEKIVLEETTEEEDEITRRKYFSKMDQIYFGEEEPATIIYNNDNEDIGTVEKKKKKPKKKDDEEIIEVFTKGIASIYNGNNDIDEEQFGKYRFIKNAEDGAVTKLSLHKSYINNNKIGFLNDIKDKLRDIKLLEDVQEKASCDTKDDTEFKSLTHQLIAKLYLNSHTPYRGLLFYHGLGSGKTCTSIGIIESMKYTYKKIYILTPKSLADNYRTQMRFCGEQLFKNENYWDKIKIPAKGGKERKQLIQQVSLLTFLPEEYISKKKEVFLALKDPPVASNYNTLSAGDKKKLNEQITKMIDSRFNFISYNGITDKKWREKYSRGGSVNPFNNSVIVIDEAHNFVSRIINKLNKNDISVSTKIYDSILNAENCRVVLLTGTPLVNYPSEMGVIFNLIGGNTHSIELSLHHKTKSMLEGKNIVKLVKSNFNNIDLITYDKRQKQNILKLTRNPYGFITLPDGKIKYDFDDNHISIDELRNELVDFLEGNEYTIVKSEIISYKKFPDTHKEFEQYFISDDNRLKNVDYFKKKVVGLVSYLGDKQELMPSLIAPDEKYHDIVDYSSHLKNYFENEQIFIVECNTNSRTLNGYYNAYTSERSLDISIKSRAKQLGVEGESSYRIYTRSACNFVLPENMTRPKFISKTGKKDKKDEFAEIDFEMMGDNEKLEIADVGMDTSDISKPDENKLKYFNDIQTIIREFKNNPYRYFENEELRSIRPINDKLEEKLEQLRNGEVNLAGKKIQNPKPTNEYNNSLNNYSPKYVEILKNLTNQDNIGCHLLYSNFKTLEGIGLFSLVLNYYGFIQMKIEKSKQSSTYRLITNSPYYTDEDYEQRGIRKQYYALYTGEESDEVKEMYRNIYNSNLDVLPNEIKLALDNILKSNANRRIRPDDDDETKKAKTDEIVEEKNIYGGLMKLLIISASGAEGIDLKNVRFVHIMEPYWHPVRIIQVIGRAKRICSHKDLKEQYQNVKIFMYLLVFPKSIRKEVATKYAGLLNNNPNMETTDEALYRIMMTKKELIEEFLTILKETSIDCVVNYDDPRKCLTFSNISEKDKLMPITKINYKNDVFIGEASASVATKSKKGRTRTGTRQKFTSRFAGLNMD